MASRSVVVNLEAARSLALAQFSLESGLDVSAVVGVLTGMLLERGFVGRPVRDGQGYVVGTSEEMGCFWIGRLGKPGSKDLGEVVWMSPTSHAGLVTQAA